MAMDWTYDMFVEDCNHYTALNAEDDDYRAYFIGRMKLAVYRFLGNWYKENNNHLYSDVCGWVGDAFVDRYGDFFSDFYKDAYGQRPHLPMWYYVHILGLPMSEDVARTFCATPIEDAIDNAKRMREHFDD